MDQGLAALRLRFRSQALPEETFSVVSFEGTEGLSELYAFTVKLASARKDLDLDAVMGATASLVVSGPDGDVPVHGILETFAEGATANGLYFYRARLRPRLWRLTLDARNQVFVDKALPEVIQKILTDGGLPTSAFELRLQGNYAPREFICQYGESLYDFLSRWLARFGLYYFFEQGTSAETLIITDTKIAHGPAPGATKLTYARTSGLGASTALGTVHDFGLRRRLTPATVTLKDYNYRKPNLDLTAQQALGAKGAGETYHFGSHHRTPDEGKALAKIRAEALAAQSSQVFGAGFAPWLRPGYTFELAEHFNGSLNGTYLVLSVSHQGHANLAKAAGLGPAALGEGRLHYENTFTALDAATQYRPPQTERKTVAGLMTGRVDAAGSGTYAELDDQGRYKIRLPFDQSGLGGGKASAPVRLLTPYGGSGFGLHCPLHKGTETALGYMDGNPDRPIILGAAPNPEHASQVTSDNQTMCCLTTGAGHKLHIEDKAGSQRILLQSMTGEYMRIGAHNDPDDDKGGYFSEEGIKLYAPDNHWMEISVKNEFLTVFGEYMLNILGWDNELRLECLKLKCDLEFAFYLAHRIEFESIHEALEAFKLRMHPERKTFSLNQQHVTVAQIRATDGTTSTALLNSSQAAAEDLSVATEAVRVAGVESGATAQTFDTSQEALRLAGERTQAYQDAIELSQQKQDLAASKVVMRQEDIQSCVSKTESYGVLNKAGATRIATAANKVETVANDMAFFGIYSKG